MARPEGSPFAERLYAALEPIADQDESLDWPLLKYCIAIAKQFDQVETYARDGDNGEPGWSIIVDTERIPIEAVRWFAQITGSRQTFNIRPGETEEDYLARVRPLLRDANNMKRGTPAAIVAAAQETLTGDKTVIMNERDGSAYRLTIVTLLSETPDPAVTLKAIESQKPAGIVLAYDAVDGATYLSLRASFETYQEVKDAYEDYSHLRVGDEI